jgi:hypothetical protein
MQSTSADRSRRRPIELGVWSCFFTVPLLFLGAALSVPYVEVAKVVYRIRERRFARHMAALNRTITFEDYSRILENGEGTHIHEWESAFKGPVRWWWTSEDVAVVNPDPTADRYTMTRDALFQPFLEWIYREYTSPSGKALLVIATNEQKKSIRDKLQNKGIMDVPTFRHRPKSKKS